MLTVTEAARAKFKEITEREDRKGHGLRVIVNNGGTFQPDFALNFVAPDQARDDDVVVDAGGLNVYLDPDSAKFLREASVDFLETPTQSGFKIDAPHAGLPKPSGSLAEKIEKALEGIFTRLVSTKSGLRLGITEKEAVKLTPGATDLAGDRVLALDATPYDPEGDWKGTLRIFVTGEPRVKLDNIQICLLCEKYDEAEVARRVVKIGQKIGFAFEPDEEAPNTLYDPGDHTRDLWVSFGRGVIVIDADLWED